MFRGKVLAQRYKESHRKGNLRKTFRLLLLAAMVLNSNIVQSAPAVPTPTDKEELHRRTQQEAENRKERDQRKDVLSPRVNLDEDVSLPEETPAFTVNEILLEGEQLQRFSWIQNMLNQYNGKKVGKEGIHLIAKRITNALISRGYITTRITIPEQDISTGILRFKIIPGIIRHIHFASPEKESQGWQNAFPTSEGDILNLRHLEQGLEQMKRVPSQDVDMKIAPGDKPGESDVILTIKKEKPWRISLTTDDAGSKATGKMQASGTLSIDNPLGLNDLFYMSFNHDIEQKGHLYGTHGSNFHYSIPNGYWTFSVNSNEYNYHQTILNAGVPVLYSGNSNTLQFDIDRLIYRDQKSKTNLKFSIIKKESKSYIDDVEAVVQRKNVTAAQLAIDQRRYYGKTVVDAELAYRWGVPWFNAQAELNNPAPGSPTTRYQLWIFDLSLKTPVKCFNKDATYYLNFRTQYTKDTLYASDYFSIGNRYTVRGFDGEQTLSSENGWYIRNELGVPVSKESEAYIGLDYGEVGGDGSQWLLGKRLAGAVIGLRGGNQGFYYDVFAGWPIYKPEGFQTSNSYIGFQLNHRL